VHSLIIGNRDELLLGGIKTLLSSLDSSYEVRIREDRDENDFEGDFDLAIHLGSSWSLTKQEVRTACTSEIEFIQDCASRGVQTLGICFGAQLMSLAFGGCVFRNHIPEIGWKGVNGTGEHEFLSGQWMQWHYDGFTCPEGGLVLASNEVGIQAFRVGTSLGLQFHPEANVDVVSRWSSGDGATELQNVGESPIGIVEETRLHEESAVQRLNRIMDWFLALPDL
jgi:GMP synthase-like glutamine amidotransferase